MNAYNVGVKLLVRTCVVSTMIFGFYVLAEAGAIGLIVFIGAMIFLSLITFCFLPVLTMICRITSRLPYPGNSCVAWFAFAWNMAVVLSIMGISLFFLNSVFTDIRFFSTISVCCWIATYSIKRRILNFIKANRVVKLGLVE